MLMVYHHLDPSIAEDQPASRIRSIAAEGIPHDLGALPMMSSDSQAMAGSAVIIRMQTPTR